MIDKVYLLFYVSSPSWCYALPTLPTLPYIVRLPRALRPAGLTFEELCDKYEAELILEDPTLDSEMRKTR